MTALSEIYKTSFRPEEYLNMYFNNLTPGMKWMLNQLHQIFSGIGPLGEGIRQGIVKSLIEVGCGPSPFNTASASRWASAIIWSDYTPANIDFMCNWLKETSITPAMAPFFEHVSGLEDSYGEAIAERLRKVITSVMAADVTLPNPFSPLYIQADVVISHLCLEFVVSEKHQFKEIVKNVASLVAPGGYLVLQSAIGANYYYTGGMRLPATNVDKLFLEQSVKDAGLQMVEYQEFSIVGNTDHKENTDHVAVYTLIAVKGKKK